MSIDFYKEYGPLGYLANYSNHGFTKDGVYYKTAEHYYQASKFDDEEIRKKIICSKTPKEASNIGRDRNNRQKMAVTDVNAKKAITHFKVLERFNNNTLLECILDTGRTHQIRVHLSYIGYPVSNDPLYGKGKCSEFGQMLHSYSIKFKHPRTGKEIKYEVDPPKEFEEKLELLRSEE